MNTLQKLMLEHLHPVKFILETIGTIWAVYFLWNQNWLWALVFGLGLPLLSTILLWNKKLPDSRSGYAKLALIHAHPLNLILHLIGGAVAIYGIWMHGSIAILLGVTIILVGHLWGWKTAK